jgi:hypothetical protein
VALAKEETQKMRIRRVIMVCVVALFFAAVSAFGQESSRGISASVVPGVDLIGAK